MLLLTPVLISIFHNRKKRATFIIKDSQLLRQMNPGFIIQLDSIPDRVHGLNRTATTDARYYLCIIITLTVKLRDEFMFNRFC